MRSYLIRTSFLLLFVLTSGNTIWGYWSDATQSSRKVEKTFEIYWNVPTFQCHKYGLSFEEVSANYRIRQNAKDEFRGDEFAILYDPGMFPAILKLSNGTTVIRNGGVPQEGDLDMHLNVFREHLLNQIPNKWFSGIGVIDFESWRPIFRQNWASLVEYKNLSIYLVRQEHPFWDSKTIEREATSRFEKYARYFMEETLKTAKQLRPAASWGYYGYPQCFNSPGSPCDAKTVVENDRISWLFDIEDVLLPSVYERLALTPKERVSLVRERLAEAVRVSQKMQHHPKILTYFWYKYQDQSDVYLTETDVNNIVEEIRKDGVDGIIIWGSSNDVNSRDKCESLRKYLQDILGPISFKLTQSNGNESTSHNGISNDVMS